MGSVQTIPEPRIDAYDKVTGRALYTEDLPLPYGVAYCAILGSPHSHARIRSINTEKAERLPGVLAVLTRDHLDGMDPYIRGAGFGGNVPANQSFIAIDKVRYDGDPVAAVAAENLALAEYALNLIQVEYEDLPAVFDLTESIASDAPLVHEALASNIVGEYRWDWGDVEQGFRESHRVFEDVYVFPSVFHYPIENIGGCSAQFLDDQVELVVPVQHLFSAQQEIAELFGLEPEQVRVRMPYVGGGFGAKELKPAHLITLWLARKTGRPIVTIPSSEQSMRSDCRHQVVYKVKTGVKADGSLWAEEIELLVDEGAYARQLGVTRLAIAGAWGPYHIPHMRMIGHSVFTNRVPAGAFRGLAKAQVTWGYECHYDMVARQMGIDPMEFRIKNFMRRGDVVTEGASPLDTDYDVLLRQAARSIGWDGSSKRVGEEVLKAESETKPLRGRGLSTTFRHGYFAASNTLATVTMNKYGKVKIWHSGAEIGGGVYTVMALVAAQTLGLPATQIEVSHPDTLHPYSEGIGSSRDTVCMGMAVQNACEDLKQELFRTAAVSKGGTQEEWRLAEGDLWHGEETYSIEEILSNVALFPGAVIMGKGSYVTPLKDNPFMGTVPHWEVSVGAAEVEVDPQTGEVHVLNYATVCDVGKAIHPSACKGQLDGGAIMGLGDTLYEEMVYRDGQFLNGDPMQYRLPVIGDIPHQFHAVLVENCDGPGPLGSKGMGQTAISPVAPAIANAVFDATGVRIKDLPITPEKILHALGKL